MDARDFAEPALQELLGANAVLPEQYWSNDDSTNRSGERALMWAVLADGIECYRRNAWATSSGQRLEFLEAESWIQRNDWEWPFSFVNLCEAFGFRPDGVRDSLISYRRQAVRQAFKRRRYRPVTLRAA
ncbi:MAG TPA: hypothetical protein VMT89_03370 [Candidatus Acidoferrales bacterium]|nr:hypothetical protein [Candidatus Acidoferrales bacterium]